MVAHDVHKSAVLFVFTTAVGVESNTVHTSFAWDLAMWSVDDDGVDGTAIVLVTLWLTIWLISVLVALKNSEFVADVLAATPWVEGFAHVVDADFAGDETMLTVAKAGPVWTRVILVALWLSLTTHAHTALVHWITTLHVVHSTVHHVIMMMVLVIVRGVRFRG